MTTTPYNRGGDFTLPMYADEKPKNRKSWQCDLRKHITVILSDPASRNIAGFLTLNLSFAFVELFYGIATNSLGLISDSFHMFFDCTGLLAGLVASVITKWATTEIYSYGYVRAEIMSGFCNAIFLCFVAFFVFKEAIERLFEPPEVDHGRLFVVSVLGLLVNLVGVFVFSGAHGHSHGGGSHGHSHGGGGGASNNHQDDGMPKNALFQGASYDPHYDSDFVFTQDGSYRARDHGTGEQSAHSHGSSQIVQGVFLHVLADTLGSVGVIISSLLIHWFGWHIADPICSIIISTLIVLSVIPMIRDSLAILMQRQPTALDHQLPQCFRRVCQLPGVVTVQEPHFWTLCTDVYVGNLRVEVQPGTDYSYIRRQVHQIFGAGGVRQLYCEIVTPGEALSTQQHQDHTSDLSHKEDNNHHGHSHSGGGHGHSH